MIHIYKDENPVGNMNPEEYRQVLDTRSEKSFRPKPNTVHKCRKKQLSRKLHLTLFAALGALLDDLLSLRVDLLIVDVARSLDLLALRWLRVVRCFAGG
jgi:hypothetical protein